MRCPYCEGEVTPSATKCRHCGEWLRQRTQEPPPPPPSATVNRTAPGPAPQYVPYPVKQQESAAFAAITLIFLFLLWPIGALLTLIGLITGPKRGCFVALLLVFIVLPLGLLTLGFFYYLPELKQIWYEIQMELQQMQ